VFSYHSSAANSGTCIVVVVVTDIIITYYSHSVEDEEANEMVGSPSMDTLESINCLSEQGLLP